LFWPQPDPGTQRSSLSLRQQSRIDPHLVCIRQYDHPGMPPGPGDASATTFAIGSLPSSPVLWLDILYDHRS
jgi:hypothetical protein